MDRPPRKTKVVNYCEAKDFDDDDEDFACAKPPPSKKPREDVNLEHKKTSSKSSSQDSNSQSTEKSRRPLDERLQERDLEAAIILSMLDNTDQDQSPASTGEVGVKVTVEENTDQTSLRRSNCSVDGDILGLDEIISEKESLSRQRKAAAKATEEQKKQLTDKDEDYEPKLTPDSGSDEDFSEPADSEDEEFTVKKVSKTKKKEKVTKKEKTKPPPASKKEKTASKPKSKMQTTASTPVRSPPAAKCAPKRPSSSSTVSTSKPASSLSPAGGRIPKWNPPGQVGKSPTSGSAVKSPGQGLRLGLSRRVRVKPLHPSVATH
ncbi:RAD51-associated protein 1 [Acanthopagrus schlegelii]